MTVPESKRIETNAPKGNDGKDVDVPLNPERDPIANHRLTIFFMFLNHF